MFSTYALLVPFEKLLNTIFNINLMCPSKKMKLADIYELTHSTIRFSGIKLNCSGETYCLDYKFSKLANGDFLPCTHIDVTVADLAKAWDCATTTS